VNLNVNFNNSKQFNCALVGLTKALVKYLNSNYSKDCCVVYFYEIIVH
jgi:hypothetical protein